MQVSTRLLIEKENVSFILIVSIAYITAISYFQRPVTSSQLVVLIICSLVFLLMGIFGFNFCKNKQLRAFSIFYLLIQLLLASTLIQLTKAGLILLITMALVSQAVMLLTRQMSFLFCGVILFIIIFPIAQRASLQATITATLVYLAGITFVVVFTQTALNEKNSRLEVERLVVELNSANQQLRQYLTQTEELATTKERNRLAREIHDSLGHHLTVINLQLEVARSVFRVNMDEALSAVNKAKLATQEALVDVRKSVATLRSSPIEGESLIPALEKLVKQTTTTGIKTDLVLLGDVRSLSTQVELAIYRTVQEGLTNACKYSKAIDINVLLDFRLKEKVKLTVKDNGVGVSTLVEGFGLMCIKERTDLLGGRLMIDTNLGKGFVLELELAA